MKKVIKITENQLNKMIANAVQKILESEDEWFGYVPEEDDERLLQLANDLKLDSYSFDEYISEVRRWHKWASAYSDEMLERAWLGKPVHKDN